MPAKSKAQQRFMGMVRATQKGEEPASAKVAKAAQSMDPKDTEDFASTKHKGLPEKKKEEQKLREMIRDMIVVAESDLPTTTRKDKIVTVVHKRSGKELVITDTPSARKKYKRMGYLVSEASSDKYTKRIQKIAKDNTLTFDDYDANDRPIFISSKNEEMEFTIDKKGNVWSHDGYRDKKIGNIRGYKNESINAAKASEIRKKLLKKFGDDPLYKEFILAKTPKEQKKALDTLKSIRGSNAIRLMQKYAKSLQKESIKEATKINIDDLLKNPKIQKLLKSFGVKRDENAVIKLLNYFAVNPSQLKRYGFA